MSNSTLEREVALVTAGTNGNGSSTPAVIVEAPQGKKGSALIKYDQCRLYNKHRRPVGMNWAIKRLERAAQRLRLPLREIEIAALCSGTCQNEAEMVRLLDAKGGQFKALTCIDGSDGMLSGGRSEFAGRPEQINFHQADVLRDELPIERQHFISCIQAVQHFEDSRLCRHFSTLGTFYKRVRQKLVQGGEFFQIVSLPDQVLHSFWFYNLISGMPGVTAELDPAHHFAHEHPPLERVFGNLEANGFKVNSWKLIKAPHFREESYYGDPEILFDEEFRHCSSLFWIMKNRGLTERYDEIARARIEDGSVLEHRTNVEKVREQIGISIAVSAEAV